MRKSWSEICSADLQIGVDGADACQNALQEMGVPKHLDTEISGFLQAARLRACLALAIVVVLLYGSGIAGATPPPEDIDPEAWAKVRAQLDAQGLRPASPKAARDVPVETAKLLPVPSWKHGFSYFGKRIAVDGDTIVVGATDDGNGYDAGAAYIFDRNEGGTGAWGQVARLLASDGTAGDHFGLSVSISGDTVVVGASWDDDNGEESGSAYVFERDCGGTGAWGQVAKLLASDGDSGDYFGLVSISGDTVVVGASYDDENGEDSGSAYVFERDQGGADAWGQVAKLLASDGDLNDRFGTVSISGDVVVVGARYDDDYGYAAGSAYVFERDQGGNGFWGEVAKLLASDLAPGDFFGCSVSISGDTVIVGAEWDDDNGENSGSAYIFSRDHGGVGGWGQVAKLLASDGETGDVFGRSVSIIGGTVVVGASEHGDNDPGSAYVFGRDHGGAGVWGQLAELVASDGASDDNFGCKVSISGYTVVVGADRDDDNGLDSGSVYIYERDHGGVGTWGQANKRVAPDILTARGDAFGKSAAIDGDTLVITAYRDDDNGLWSGSAYVFERDYGGDNAWGQIAKLLASDGAFNDWFGTSVSISGDTAVIGAPGDESGIGSAYVFERDQGGTGTWVQVVKLTALDGAISDFFGSSVSISGDTVIVGMKADDDNGQESGSVYVFERDQGGADVWGQVAKLLAADGESFDSFGSSVSICDDALVVGAVGDDDNGDASGSAYIYERDQGGEGAWGQVAKLSIQDGAANDYFGRSVSISEHTVIVGADGDNDLGPESGSAFIFERDHSGAGSWSQVGKLVASDGTSSARFGGSVSISGDTVIVGAYGDDDYGFESGSAYIFERDHDAPGAWGQVAKLTVSSEGPYDWFGTSVSIHGNTLVVGSTGDDDLGEDSGSAYVFDILRDPEVIAVSSTPATADGVLTEDEWSVFGFTDLSVAFTEPMADPAGDTDPGDVTNPANWLLVEAGANGSFETVACAAGVGGDDLALSPDLFVYDDATQTVGFRAASGAAMPSGRYALFACGTLESGAGLTLDGNGDGTVGDDYSISFGIDGEPPTAPSGLQTTTHGSPSQATVIETSWTASVDDLTGLAGYAWTFSTADSWVCDEVIDGTDPSTASAVLADGEWWFHACAGDVMDNWSAVASLGPMVIDTTPPAVMAAGSEGGTADGVLTEGEAVLAAVTQLMVRFSEPVFNPAGDATPGDLTNPDHYRVLDLGPDGVLSTPDCAVPVAGDDLDIDVFSAVAWAGDEVASLMLAPFHGLPRGRYALLVCGLDDPLGNGMSGPWVQEFAVNANNLLEDPNFDAGGLASWDTESPGAGDIDWFPYDPSSESSGVAVVQTTDGIGEVFSLTQCVDVFAGIPYGLGGMVMVDSGAGDSPEVKGQVEFYRNAGCTDLLEMRQKLFAGGDTATTWTSRYVFGVRAPVEALSARAGFTIMDDSAGGFEVYLDEIAFYEGAIFVDGFETGGPTWWDRIIP